MEMQITHAELIDQKPALGAKSIWTLVYDLIDDTDDIQGWLHGSTPCLESVLDDNGNDIFYVIDQETITRLELLIAKKRKQQQTDVLIDQYEFDRLAA